LAMVLFLFCRRPRLEATKTSPPWQRWCCSLDCLLPTMTIYNLFTMYLTLYSFPSSTTATNDHGDDPDDDLIFRPIDHTYDDLYGISLPPPIASLHQVCDTNHSKIFKFMSRSALCCRTVRSPSHLYNIRRSSQTTAPSTKYI